MLLGELWVASQDVYLETKYFEEACCYVGLSEIGGGCYSPKSSVVVLLWLGASVT